MARVRKEPDMKAKESEKNRAKRNRENFRELIVDLNNCVSNDNLSTNKCLSTAVSILMLDKVHGPRPPDSHSSEEGSPSSSRSPGGMSSRSSQDLQVSITPQKEFTHLLSARECFGIGFNETGIILYTSPNFESTVGYKESALGEPLSRITPQSKDILSKIFSENTLNFICMVHMVKMNGKDLSPFHFRGKTLPCDGGGNVFLGYAEKEDTIMRNPLQQYQINVVVINTDFSYAGGRNIFVDSLLGYSTYGNCVTEHIVTEDLQENVKDFKCLQDKGYVEQMCRLRCIDNSLLYVLAKVFMHVNSEGEPILISYGLPIAFSSQEQQTIDEGMRFITSKESWLALMPSFLDNPGSNANQKPSFLDSSNPENNANQNDLSSITELTDDLNI